MPFYDQVCESCGLLEDVCRGIDERNICDQCGGEARVVLAPVRTVGIVWSNQEHSSQLGRTFETNAQKRAWLKAHPNVSPVSKGSREDTEFKESIRERRDTVLARAGFKNNAEYQAEAKKRKGLTPIKKKPMVSLDNSRAK